jgi:hypothetical protein
MRGGMRHKALLFLGFVLLALVMACEGLGSTLEKRVLGPPTGVERKLKLKFRDDPRVDLLIGE